MTRRDPGVSNGRMTYGMGSGWWRRVRKGSHDVEKKGSVDLDRSDDDCGIVGYCWVVGDASARDRAYRGDGT